MNKQSKKHLILSIIIVVVAAAFMISFAVGVNKSPTGMAAGNIIECESIKEGMCIVCNHMSNEVCNHNRLSELYQAEECGEWSGC